MASDYLDKHAAGEKKLSKLLKKFFKGQAGRIIESLGSNLTVANVKNAFDDADETKKLITAIGPTFQALMIDGSGDVLAQFASTSQRGTKAAAEITGGNDFSLPRRVEDAIGKAFDDLMKEAYWQAIQATTKGVITDTITQGLKDGLTLPKLAKLLASTLDGMGKLRAEMIARTETTAAYGAGHQASYSELAADGLIYGKKWLAVIDADTRSTHSEASGQIVAADEDFTIGGVSAQYPCAPNLPAKERVRCRCTTVVVRNKPKK